VESFFTASLHISDFVQTQNETKILTKRKITPGQPNPGILLFRRQS
jgi:hypothetical protein